MESGSPSGSDVSEGGDIPFKNEVDESQETVTAGKQRNGKLKDDSDEAEINGDDGSEKGESSGGEDDDEERDEDE